MWWLQLELLQSAVDVGNPIQHPLLDRVAECSAKPRTDLGLLNSHVLASARRENAL